MTWVDKLDKPISLVEASNLVILDTQDLKIYPRNKESVYTVLATIDRGQRIKPCVSSNTYVPYPIHMSCL